MPFGFGDVLDPVRATVRVPLVNARTAVALDDQVWKRITSQQLGVSAADPDGHKMGMNIAYRSGSGLNWYPADGYKQTLVGTVDRYVFYNPSDSGDEADWNIYIKPDPPFAYLIEDVLTNADLSVVHKGTTTPGYVMEAEVTPDEHFYNNPYFNSNGNSNRVGRKIGVYGPWVMEEKHGWRPEIHPSEILWWRDVSAGRTPRTTWTIAVMQDDSNRFDLESNYRGRIDRPWSAVPRRAVIDVAVAIDPAKPKTLEVRDLYRRNVQVSDPAGATSASATFKGQRVVTLNKRLSDPKYVRARFGTIASVNRGAALHCFLRLNVEIGVNDRGGEGYVVLEVKEVSG
jgi:hypothetical protein